MQQGDMEKWLDSDVAGETNEGERLPMKHLSSLEGEEKTWFSAFMPQRGVEGKEKGKELWS